MSVSVLGSPDMYLRKVVSSSQGTMPLCFSGLLCGQGRAGEVGGLGDSSIVWQDICGAKNAAGG